MSSIDKTLIYSILMVLISLSRYDNPQVFIEELTNIWLHIAYFICVFMIIKALFFGETSGTSKNR